MRLHVPPLRERPGDILLLARQAAEGCDLTVAAVQQLEAYG
jgi:transcriptional regulator with GAF, ATPase, and Fis domain